MRKGFLAAVGGMLIAGGSAYPQVPYGLPYSPGYGGNYAQPVVYANGYGYGNGYPPSYGYGYAPSYGYGYAPQIRPSYAYLPGYGYYPTPAGYANTAQVQPATQTTLTGPVTQVPDGSVMTNVPEAAEPVAEVPGVAAAPAAAPPAAAPAAKIAPQAAPAPPTIESACQPSGGWDAGWCGKCGPRFYASAEYLLWWIKGDSVPPLVTTGPATIVPPGGPQPGALGTPGTAVLFGGDRLDNDPFSGGRFTVGFWLDSCRTKAIEVSYFFLGSLSDDFNARSSGAPGSIVLARPFLDVSSGLQNAELDAFPGLAAGTKSVSFSSQLQGGEANLMCNLCCCAKPCDCGQPAHGYRVDLISGFRYLNLGEKLGIDEDTQVLPGSPVLAGENIQAFDLFDTRDQFYGGQVGIRAEVWRKRLFANFGGKVALGDTHQTVNINGFTTLTPAVPGLGGPGDLLTLPSNIGHFTRDQFSVVPEVDINVGYQVTSHVRVYVGYSFLYWSNVQRPGEAIDLGVNSTRTPTSLLPPSGPLGPLFTFHNSDFWAQGIDFGLQIRF